MFILVLNAGSSSLKFQLFQSQRRSLKNIIKGVADAINLPHAYYSVQTIAEQKTWQEKIHDHHQAIEKILQLILEQKVLSSLSEIQIIGHRVVHGGETFKQPTKITPAVTKKIKELCKLAPLHNPANLAVIESCQKILPKAAQVAVFDTAFHETLPEVAYLYPIPINFYQEYGIRRYGFHGISHEYVSKQAIKWLKANKLLSQKIISCHLGNGCSVTAIKNGKSIETSMGYTPLEGLMMGTRSGNVDPYLPLILAQDEHLTINQAMDLLNKESGLLGVSGLSSDIRVLHGAAMRNNQKAILALKLYCHIVAKYIAAYTTGLGGLDCLIFTAGIGEHAHYIRSSICQELRHFGIKLNHRANQQNQWQISNSDSSLPVLVVPTNEELAIAQAAHRLLKH